MLGLMKAREQWYGIPEKQGPGIYASQRQYVQLFVTP